ncbi:MAG: ABC transporter permease subunit [Fervidicoccaceae archaeon]
MSWARKLKDRLFSALASLVALAFAAVALHVVLYVTWRGLPVLASEGLSLLFEKPAAVTAERPGGVAPALVGTLYLTASSLAIAAPMAALAAVFSVEFPRSPLSRLVRLTSRALLEVPTISVGLLVFSLLVLPLGRFTGLAGTVALALVMLPYVYVYAESALSSVPSTYVEAGYALGMRRAQVALGLRLKMAKRGVWRGVLMATMKAMGETAPLLFTVYGARSVVFGGPLQPIDALPLMIFQFIQSGYENWRALAWGGAFVLLVLYMAMYAAYRLALRGETK